jgi:CheY-like chemotaxis protein
MEQTSGSGFGPPNSWAVRDPDKLAAPVILVVEDDQDIREMLATLLGMAGFTVVACDTAERALNALREQTFDVILTDYALPHRTGLWMLRSAEAEGLIDGTPVLMVTAYPDVAGAGPYQVIHKPFDLDDLVERVRYCVEGEGPRRRRVPPVGDHTSVASAFRRKDNGGADGDGHVPGCPDPVELILYVSARSPHSAAAVRNIRKVLDRFNSARVKLTVCDLSKQPNGGVEDAVAFTPTLVRRHPGPRTFILGHMSNPELLLELLADCETGD